MGLPLMDEMGDISISPVRIELLWNFSALEAQLHFAPKTANPPYCAMNTSHNAGLSTPLRAQTTSTMAQVHGMHQLLEVHMCGSGAVTARILGIEEGEKLLTGGHTKLAINVFAMAAHGGLGHRKLLGDEAGGMTAP